MQPDFALVHAAISTRCPDGVTHSLVPLSNRSEFVNKGFPQNSNVSGQEAYVRMQNITIHEGDLPSDYDPGTSIAIDTETMGLLPHRDRLCVVQLSKGDGTAEIVRMPRDRINAPVLREVISSPDVMKIFHFARFDVAVLKAYLDVECRPLWCTKIASKLVRTYTERHGLKDLCQELLGIELSKAQQSSDWGADRLSDDQAHYAAHDVLHLHQIKAKLETMLKREERLAYAETCFEFLPTRAKLDLAGFGEMDVFAH